jgi:hypothetical protein
MIGSTFSKDYPTNISVLISGQVKQGKYLVVSTNGSKIIRGEFLEVSTANDSSLSERTLQAARELDYSGVIPLPGDSVVFTYAVKGGRLIGSGRIRSLEPFALVLRRPVLFPDSATRIAVDSLRSLYVDRKGEVNITSLRGLILWVSTATTQLVLRVDSDTTHVPLSDIDSIELEGAHYAYPIGLGIGAAIDIALIVSLWGATHTSGGGCIPP